MKTKVYLNDWFYNTGIVGFLRILEFNEDNFIEMKENYIEFDTENLRNFDKYYFNYFFNKYNVAERVIDRTNNLFSYIEDNIEKPSENKEEDKFRRDKIKSYKKYIKDIIKKQLDKIKKINESIYNEIKDKYEKIDNEQTRSGIQTIKNTIFENIKQESINKRLTLNLFKSILTSTYFGQPSFLNVVKTALSYEEQQELMYKDYISNIVETGFINDILNNKYTLNDIENYIGKVLKEGIITNKIEKVYSNIKTKYIEKNRTLEDIQKYIKDNVINNCLMCENEFGMTEDYSESNFVPLAVSSDNMKNFFWNQNVKFPICDMCKLILFCIPAGTTSITKAIKENGEYKEKQVLSFVNLDTSVQTLSKTNNNFADNSKYNNLENPYTNLILNLVEQEQQITKWQLDNIFVVEFDAEYLAFSRIEYFNIRRYIAEFFQCYSKNTLNMIKDYRLKLQIVDYMLKNRDIKYIINERLRDELKKDKSNGWNLFLATRTRLILNMLKKERAGVDNIKKNDNKLFVLYNLGVDIHEQLKKSNNENKLDGYIYRMLNSIKTGNKKEFMDTVIRIHLAMEKDISQIFIETMQDTNLDFESIGHSFLSGLISNKYENGGENNG